MTDPLSYSAPLRKSLKGYRKLRVGDHRVIFRLDKTMIKVLIIGHRKDVYESTPSRMPGDQVG
jgi:mRNA interferase RelE/StbE